MHRSLESKLKMLLSVYRKLKAQVAFYNAQQVNASNKTSVEVDEYIRRAKGLIDGGDGLLFLVSEEEAYVLDLHIVKGLKWRFVIQEYETRWPSEIGVSEKTYQNHQKSAISKMIKHIETFSESMDFSWLDDPLIEELSTSTKTP